jgi:hypothetical protein
MLDKKDKLPACGAVEALDHQGTIHQSHAGLSVYGHTGRLFRYGRLSYHGGFLSLATGCMLPLAI